MPARGLESVDPG